MRNIIDHATLNVQPSGIRVIFEKIVAKEKQGEKITRLDIGSPNFSAPQGVVDATIENLKSGMYGYSSNWGLESLRKQIANLYKGANGWGYDPSSEIIITNGSSEAVAMVVSCLLNESDHFLIPTPAWPHYIADCQIFKKPYREVVTGPESEFKLTVDLLSRHVTSDSRALILNSPGNPTGSVYTQEEFESIYNYCRSNNIILIIDEIYQNINYENSRSLIEFVDDKRDIIYINGFSKNYGMTGFRVGYVMAHSSIAQQILKYHQYTTVCGQAFVQQACADFLSNRALREDYQAYIRGALDPLKDIVLNYYNKSLIPMSKPSGAFYSFARIPSSFANASEFAVILLDENLISVVPGDAFGSDYDQYYRISYGSVSKPDLEAALETISGFY